MAVHWEMLAHETPAMLLPPSTPPPVMTEPDPGSKASSCALVSMTTHRETDGHETLTRYVVPSMFVELVIAPDPGLNVTWFPPLSTAVHCEPDVHAMLVSECPGSTAWVVAPGVFGANFTSFPRSSTA